MANEWDIRVTTPDMVENPRRAAKRNRDANASSSGDPRTAALLAWYDRHRRALPWRSVNGQNIDPYRVWLSEVMLQQTTVEAVKSYFAKFLVLWPDVKALAGADDQAVLSAWAGLGYYARARNLIACARKVVDDFDGVFPGDEEALRALPGIGAYTAAAIAAIAFGRPAVVIDGNIERVVTRLAAIVTPLPAAKSEIRAVLAPMVPAERPGDFAQALMDLGSGICTPRNPACRACPLGSACRAFQAGNAASYPVKPARKARPVRFGVAYVAQDPDGRILLGTRAEKGLLARMAEVPGSAWAEGIAPPSSAPLAARWHTLAGGVVHVFTHFELRLEVRAARLERAVAAPAGMRWVAPGDLGAEPLPTLMRKVIDAATRA